MSNATDTPPSERSNPYHSTMVEQENFASILRLLLLLVRRRPKMMLFIVLFGTSFGGLVAYGREPSYSAEALVMIKPQENKIINIQEVATSLGGGIATDSGVTTMIETQVKLLTSSVYLSRLLDRASELGKDEVSPNEPSSILGPLASLATALPESWLIATGLANEASALSKKLEIPKTNDEKELRRDKQEATIAKNLSVAQQGRSLVLAISYASKNPHEAAQVANTLADLYVEDQINEKLNATKLASTWIEIRLADLKQELENSEQAVELYRSKHQLFEHSGITINSQQMSDLNNLLVATRANRSEKETRLHYIHDLQARGEDLSSVTEVLASPYLSSLWTQKIQFQQQAVQLLADYGEKHPKVQYVKAQMKEINSKINQELNHVVDNMNNEILVLRERENSIQTDINSILQKTGTYNEAEVGLRQLERQADANRKLYEEFLVRSKETKEQQGIVQPNAEVIVRAKAPVKPNSIPSSLILLASFFGSATLGLGLSWLVERLDNGIRSSKEVELLFGLTCLGLVPALYNAGRAAKSRPHRYVLRRPLSTYAEAIRSVHTALRLSNIDHPPRIIQITSAIPGEGKTVFATSLATLLAQSGHRTLLLDLDLRHPSVISRELGVKRETGLTDYVLGALDFARLPERDEEAGFDVIAVCRPPQNPAAILASQRLRDLVQRLRSEYEYVIVDSAPVLGLSDSKIVAELVDAVLFITRWEQTTFDTARDALKELAELKLIPAGIVISQVNISKHARYGYGGIDNYYHKYRKYYYN